MSEGIYALRTPAGKSLAEIKLIDDDPTLAGEIAKVAATPLRQVKVSVDRISALSEDGAGARLYFLNRQWGCVVDLYDRTLCRDQKRMAALVGALLQDKTGHQLMIAITTPPSENAA